MVGTVIRRDVGWGALSGAVQFSLCLCRIKDKIEIDGKDGEGGITEVESKRNNSERMGWRV